MFYIMTLSFVLRSETMTAETMEGKTSNETIESKGKDTPLSTGESTTTKSAMYHWPELTDFSIENILRKDFGRTIHKHANSHRPCHLSIRGHARNHLTVENIPMRRATIESGRRDSGPPVSPAISPTAAAEKQLSETSDEGQKRNAEANAKTPLLWPAWVYCTRYSDRPSSGPRTRKIRGRRKKDEKRPRTAFSVPQLQRLRQEFQICNYLTEERRRSLAMELNLSESQIKIWFQNKRAKLKKAHGYRNPLAVNLMSQGLYNHSTIPLHEESSDETD